ncbi:MAG: methyltransferase type 11 [Rhodospirillaceae bacterium]|nr:methyltransferase type 11 [Rhodospirillaceae bacterium]
MTDPKAQWEKVTALNIDQNLKLGPIYSYFLLKDPKCLAFVLSRYKFASKMLKSKKRIIEVGCGEGIGALMLAGETDAQVVGYDFDESQITYARKNLLIPFEEQNPHDRGRLLYEARDFSNDGEAKSAFDGLVCLDVIEHLPRGEEELAFLTNCRRCLKEGGVAIIGTPSLHASDYASERSQIGHINLFSPDRLVSTLENHFSNVFLFSMNDEVVHTGFDKMAHYLIALCVA